MINNELEILQRITGALEPEDDVESILRVLIAMGVSSMKIMEIDSYEIACENGNKIKLTFEEGGMLI